MSQHLDQIMGLTWSLFSLLEVNPHEAIIEKDGRNVVKYDAKEFQHSQRESLPSYWYHWTLKRLSGEKYQRLEGYAFAKKKINRWFGQRKLNQEFYADYR